jgi:glutathione peroxidase
MVFYDFKAVRIDGTEVGMEEYRGKVILVVNTASNCGFTPQFKALEELYQEYRDRGLEILGFPCNQFADQDPGTNEEIYNFCQINYGVSFTMFEKIDVNGDSAHPLFRYLQNEAKGLVNNEIKWNFTKFLVDSNGNVIRRYASAVEPMSIKGDIDKLI